jgi:murein DD-endopeptidase MepM/ murein hydrolase activator NlpD
MASRRALGRVENARQGAIASALAPEATSTRRWVPRTALLGALAAVTIVAPLSGLAQPNRASAAVGETTRVAALAENLAGGGVDVAEASALAADPAAATRALTTASRSHAREALECPVESGANGTLSAAMGGEAVQQLVMPVPAGTYRVTSHYGYRTYPFAGMHEGTDFAGPLGTPLRAVTDGVVTYAGGPRDGRTGNIVVVRSTVAGSTVEFWYGHMFADGVHATVGQEVTAGDVIGEIGNAGNSTGPHLHFEVHTPDGQTTVDPLAWLRSHDVKASPTC